MSADGTRSWLEGDLVVVELKAPMWCGTHFDRTTEINIVECFFAEGSCVNVSTDCVAQNNTACVSATQVLEAKRMARCFGSMQTCGEQWIMLSRNVDYREVRPCGIARFLGEK